MPHHYPLTCSSLPHPSLTTPCIPETLQPHTRTPRICILATLQCTHTPPRHFVPSPSSQLLECTTPTAPLPFATLHRPSQTPIFCLAPSHRQSVFRCLLRGRALALGTGGTNGHPCSLAYSRRSSTEMVAFKSLCTWAFTSPLPLRNHTPRRQKGSSPPQPVSLAKLCENDLCASHSACQGHFTITRL